MYSDRERETQTGEQICTQTEVEGDTDRGTDMYSDRDRGRHRQRNRYVFRQR